MNGRLSLVGLYIHWRKILTLTFLFSLQDALPIENTMDSDWQKQRIQLSQWAKHHLRRLASSFSCCCHYQYQSGSCSGRSRLGGKGQSMQWWKNQKDVVRDLLSDDGNKGDESDAKVMSSFVSRRAVLLYLETGSWQEENLGGKVKSFVGGCAELSEAQFPSISLGCGPCLCGPQGCQCSSYPGGVRHHNRERGRRGKTKAMGEG